MSNPVNGPKKLARSSTDKWLGGVCGGLAEYTGVDATLIRIITVVLVIVGVGTTLLVYLAAWLLMPQAEPQDPWGPPPSGGPYGPPPPSA